MARSPRKRRSGSQRRRKLSRIGVPTKWLDVPEGRVTAIAPGIDVVRVGRRIGVLRVDERSPEK